MKHLYFWSNFGQRNGLARLSFSNLKLSLSKVGFYISGKDDQKSWIETSGDDYLLSVCADGSSATVCGEYTFQVISYCSFKDLVIVYLYNATVNKDK